MRNRELTKITFEHRLANKRIANESGSHLSRFVFVMVKVYEFLNKLMRIEGLSMFMWPEPEFSFRRDMQIWKTERSVKNFVNLD